MAMGFVDHLGLGGNLEATFWNIILMISSLCTPRAILRWQRTERCDFARSQLFGLARVFLPSFLPRFQALASVSSRPSLRSTFFCCWLFGHQCCWGSIVKPSFIWGICNVIDPGKHLRRLTYISQ